MAEQAPSAQAVPEHQERGLFALFGKKEEEERHHDQIVPPASTHTHSQSAHLYPTNPPLVPPASAHTQSQSAHLYPTNPAHPAAINQQYGQGYGHGHAGQFTGGEAEKQQHTGFMGKLHRTNSSGSSSSSDEEGGKKKEVGRKKKGIKEKIKEKLPGGQHSSDEYGREGEKEEGLVDKIKEKLPGHHNK